MNAGLVVLGLGGLLLGGRPAGTGPDGVDRPIRIACVGDSITDFNTYETNLQNMLDATYALSGKHPPKYEVANFGVSGTTALDLSASYMKTPKYRSALAWRPDVLYIQLGTNDSRTGKTYDGIDRFAADCTRLVRSFQDLPTRPRNLQIYLSAPPTMPNEGHWGDNDLNLVAGVIPRIHQVARALGLPVIDQHTPTTGHPQWVRDNVHPSRDTAGGVMAAAIYEAITGLQPPATMYPPVWFVPTANAPGEGDFASGLAGWTSTQGAKLSLGAAEGRGKVLEVHRTAAAQAACRDVREALHAGGPGDWFFQADVRLASIAAGSPAARLVLTVTDDKGEHALASEPAPINTTTWTNVRAVRAIAWAGKLKAASLAVATDASCADPMRLDDVILQKYPYEERIGQVRAPSYLTAAPAGAPGTVRLAWTDNANDWAPRGHTANETGFAVTWATDAAFTRNVATARLAADATAHTVTGLAGGTTYYFRVQATGAAGNSGFTNVASATTVGDPSGPAAPTKLTAAAVADTHVRLVWADNASNETGYRVEWATEPNFVTNRGSAQVAANATSHTVTGLYPSATYAFRVRALGAASDSAPSNVVRKVTWRARPNGSAVGVRAAVRGSTHVVLTWADDCTNETGYVVECAPDASANEFAQLVASVTTKANATSCELKDLAPAGSRLSFRIRAINALGSGDNIANPPVVEGANSPTVTVLLPPEAPSKLTATVHTSSEVRLAWQGFSAKKLAQEPTGKSANETGYCIDRATDADFSEGLVTVKVAAEATSYRAAGLKPRTTYYFRVRATSAGGDSPNTPPVRATTPDAGTPAAPGGLTVRTASSSTVELSWTDLAADETGYRIERAEDEGFTKGLAATDLPAGMTSHTLTGLRPATAYYFRVRATNARGASAPSNVAHVVTLPLPPRAPTGLVAFLVTDSRAALTWTDNADNEQSFRVDRAADERFTSQLVSQSVDAEAIVHAATGLRPVATCYFRVVARNAGGESPASNVVKVVTPAASAPAAPSHLSATAVSPRQVNLFWIDHSANETGFRIERAADEPFTKDVRTLTAPADACRLAVDGLEPGATWYFRVRAQNAQGASAHANVASATTASAGASVAETFSGPAAKLHGRKGPAGWTSPWTAADGFAVTDPGGPGLAYADRHGRILVATGGRAVLGPLSTSYRQASRNTDLFAARMSGGRELDVWFSCLLLCGKGARDFNPWSKRAYDAGPQAQGAATLTYANHNSWQGGAETAKSAPPVRLDPNRVNLILCRYQVPADGKRFTWTWYVNPTDLSEPLKTAATTVWTAANPAGRLRGLDGFGIRNRTDADSHFELDEIRYGDSAAAVTPHLVAAAAPTELKAAAVSPMANGLPKGPSALGIDLTWRDNSSAEAAFLIERATDAAFTRNLATTVVPPNTTRHRLRCQDGLAAGTVYYFRVRAATATGDSSPSNTATAATPP